VKSIVRDFGPPDDFFMVKILIQLFERNGFEEEKG